MQTRRSTATASNVALSSVGEAGLSVQIDAPTSSSSESPSTTSKKPRWRWNDENSLQLVKKCHEKQVWAMQYGRTVKEWEAIAVAMNSGVTPSAGLTSGQLISLSDPVPHTLIQSFFKSHMISVPCVYVSL